MCSSDLDYPDSDTDAWDWDVLEASSFTETSLPSQPRATQLSIGNAKGIILDLPLQQPSLYVPMSNRQDYPDSDTDAWDWDVLEASLPSQPRATQLSIGNAKGIMLDLPLFDPLVHGTDPLNRVHPSLSHSMLKRMASVPDQAFPELWQPTLGAQVTILTHNNGGLVTLGRVLEPR